MLPILIEQGLESKWGGPGDSFALLWRDRKFLGPKIPRIHENMHDFSRVHSVAVLVQGAKSLACCVNHPGRPTSIQDRDRSEGAAFVDAPDQNQQVKVRGHLRFASIRSCKVLHVVWSAPDMLMTMRDWGNHVQTRTQLSITTYT